MLQLSVIYWDPKPEIFRIPYFDWPVLWYGVLFALGFAIGFPIFVGILTRYLGGKEHKKKAVQIGDRLTLYMILGTVIGARLGHFLFYERPVHYLTDPLQLFRIWEGGLASHGGAIGIIIALMIFSWRVRAFSPKLTWVRLLDFVAVPAALAAFFIRIGNFINQEVLGTATDLPWGVVFGHPADHSTPFPRHPVQIYEALFYIAVFFLLWKLSFQTYYLKTQGKLIGLFLILVFGFRFLIEFWKMEQSRLLFNSSLTMGQFLSIPLIVIGLILYFRSRSNLSE
ncbi:MAG: prolipoprotein diacylglyceryl transferase [Parachlamydiales bacterium]|nr:prolipoprotein diacylglyceryl transferase [Parachlamydiales bacterium]